MNEERIMQVFADEAFVKELLSKETPEEVQAMLAEKEIDASIDEIVKLRELIDKKVQQAQADEEELAEDELEDVAGGVIPLFAVAAAVAPLIIFGVVAGLGYGAVAVDERTRGRW